MNIRIDQDLCNACGICAEVCPRHIPETVVEDNEKITKISQERLALCMQCGHCYAICPNCAIHVDGLNEEKAVPIRELDLDDKQLLLFLQQRRSIRRYKDKPVPRTKINRIIKAVQVAPTGTGRSSTGLTVIDNPKTLAHISKLAYGLYDGLGKNLKNPIARFFIKRKAGEKNFTTLQDFVMPGMHWYIRWYKEGRSNEILRDCPALMLFHSPIYEPVGGENCLIAAFHAILMAQTMKIGTCFNDLIPPACNRVPQIRSLLGLDDDREVYASLTMGYPKYQFKRIPQRKLAEVRYIN